MPLKSTRTSWGPITRALHWLSAAIVLFALVHGYWMSNLLVRPQRLPHYQFHSLLLVYFALLLAIRIVWRLTEQSPEAPAGSAGWERAAAHLGHLALYGLLIAVLITGYMNWSAFPGRFDPARAGQMDLSLFGFFKVPAIHAQLDRNVFKFWENLHMYLSWVLAGLVVIHVLAALRHHFVRGNDVMRRMWRGVPG